MPQHSFRETAKAIADVEWGCQCHRLARLNAAVERRLLGGQTDRPRQRHRHRSTTTTSKTKPSPTQTVAAGAATEVAGSHRGLAPFRVAGGAGGGGGDAVDDAARARAFAQRLARKHEDAPVTAIAEAAWRGVPELMGAGDALMALAPHVLERFGGEGAGSVLSVLTFANAHAVDCGEAGLVLVDCGTAMTAPIIFDLLREETSLPLHTAVYTHGHADHIAVQEMEWEAPYRVVAQENVVARFDRYRKTAGYNTFINKRQFQIPDAFDYQFPGSREGDLRYPDVTYREYMRFEVGGEVFELFAAKGETDDATIVWMPRRRYCFCGDFFIWNAPNAGNPQKVQRYPEEWVHAARKIVDLRPVIVFPGHGPPILGEQRVREAFTNQARLLQGIVTYAMDGINAGVPLARLMANAPLPKELLELPYLRPRYDDPRWFVATLWRRYCGWYTFDIRHLLPVDAASVGVELARLVGGTRALAAHAEQLVLSGGAERLGVALEIAELAAAAADVENGSGDDAAESHRIRARVLRALERRESTLMAKSLYRAAAIDSEKKVDNSGNGDGDDDSTSRL